MLSFKTVSTAFYFVSRQFYNLPSLNALATFEAVARHQSLTQAAIELGVTTGAVSRQIKLLEAEIGVQLLVRNHKRIHCNRHARALHDSLRESFSGISATISNLISDSDDLSFSLGSTTAFSSLWLMPRLSLFWKQHPEIRINHILSDDTTQAVNDSVDLNIRYESLRKVSDNVILLFRDEIYPVCSPDLAKKYGHLTEPAQIAELPLLQLTHNDKSWTDWRSWFRHFNVQTPIRELNSYNNYIIALQAARDDQGILLGWDRLVQPLIKEGKLKRLIDQSYLSPGSYYLYWEKNKVMNFAASTFVKWLSDQT